MTAKGASVEMLFADPDDTIKLPYDPSLPEKKLWYSVLELAYRDATGETLISGHNERRGTARDRDEARMWFASSKRSPGSLRWLLEMTGIKTTAAQLRARVAKRVRR